jgi:hypothetical protein
MEPDRLGIPERLRRACFYLEWRDERGVQFATGFFVTRSGLALTSYHCVSGDVRAGRGFLCGVGPGGREYRFRLLLTGEADREWQQKYEIALLQAEEPFAPVEPLPCSYLPLDFPERAREWIARSVQIYGFPRSSQREETIMPSSVSGQPIRDVVETAYEERRIVLPSALTLAAPARGVDPRGMSGGPVYDVQSQSVIAVQVLWKENLYATELAHLREHAGAAASFLKPLVEEPPLAPPAARPFRWLPLLALLAAMAACLAVYVTLDRRDLPPPCGSTPCATDWALHLVRPPAQADPTGARIFEHRERLTDQTRITAGEDVRFAISAPVGGYLYVIDEELTRFGRSAESVLLFPTLRLRNGRNQVKAGEEILTPSPEDTPPTFRLAGPSAGHTGERLTFAVLREPLRLKLLEAPLQIDPSSILGPTRGERLFSHRCG